MLAQAKPSLPLNSDIPESITRFLAATSRSMNLDITIEATILNITKTAIISISVKPFCFMKRKFAFTGLWIDIYPFLSVGYGNFSWLTIFKLNIMGLSSFQVYFHQKLLGSVRHHHLRLLRLIFGSKALLHQYQEHLQPNRNHDQDLCLTK